MIKLRLYIFYQKMIYSKNEAFSDTSHHQVIWLSSHHQDV